MWWAGGAGAGGVYVGWFTNLERGLDETLPWDHLDSDIEVVDCRWTPCYDCGVCPGMGTEIQVGHTRQQLLPLAVVRPGTTPPD